MTKKYRIAGAFRAFQAAFAVKAAVEGGREPKAAHLEALGIDPVDFRAIGR
jgi:hypothetical protein